MAQTPRVTDPILQDGDRSLEGGLRPKSLNEFVGQDGLRENLRILVEAATARDEPLEHILLSGPPGLGKTTLATLLAGEMGTRLVVTSGPALERAADLVGILTGLPPKGILFVDEIHRLSRTIEEYLYPAMEDQRLDILLDRGPSARSVRLKLHPFTLVGATTRSGRLSAPLRSRFGFVGRVDFYNIVELMKIVERSARILQCPLEGEVAEELAKRGRGTPRIVNRLLRRVRDYAQVRGTGDVDKHTVLQACELLQVGEDGLHEMDRKILETIIVKFSGGPVGLNTLAACLGEEPDTIEEVHEPFLLQEGYIERTPRGREAAVRAYQALGIDAKLKPKPPGLFT
ncbi:MAG: Holliday junction branch migration DNA helicase RuvB [Candidatus Eisenbacteria bacterium]|uniref:Holliday junction branch migration complex subunit RuvB n=1 Tax=Eiseniibacteriota bacterium TaxID=2212470 RepID=A0A948RUM9_UNCEI|nr:Holliday junction branch migration DNA helicase RuvB [Candidatus Eisenbacteria bacterium]MBU1948215.1 Holliday junction branch migration DNA helicase RuvB [Candidatus Eisenbacteria bacterium]MBU2691323.1 Holliday junction branch migration DNA helicase RuvB [Candidatus Eisenbacteria bacterium]